MSRYFLIYKHINGKWSVVKERDENGVDDAIQSPFTVEVWVFERESYDLKKEIDTRIEWFRELCEESENVEAHQAKCEKMWREIEELQKQYYEQLETELMIRSAVMREITECKDDITCVHNILKKHGFIKVK